jgi:hypothetical protein
MQTECSPLFFCFSSNQTITLLGFTSLLHFRIYFFDFSLIVLTNKKISIFSSNIQDKREKKSRKSRMIQKKKKSVYASSIES